jgi:Ca2+-binding RTX toxin-like protein
MFTFSGLRPLLAIGALGAASLTVSTGPAHADGETCDGKPATMVVSSAPDGSFPAVNGTSGDDVIVVTTPDDLTVNGLGGDDTICGGAMTWMTGGAGNDELWSGWFDPDDLYTGHIDGDEGDDVIHANDNRHFIVGGSGNDLILGGDGGGFMIGGTRLTTKNAPDAPDNDTIVGGAGVDVMVADWGDDTLTGGSGEDHLILGLSSTDTDEGCDVIAANATLQVAEGTVTGFGEDTFTGFEAYNGGTRRSTLIGTAGPDDLGSGDCGTTHLVGLGGEHRLEGESDGDGKEAGVLSGNRGDDEISFNGPYDIHAGKGDDRITLESSDFRDPFPGAEIQGNGGADWFTIVGFSPGEITDLDLRRGLKSKFRNKWLPIQGVENARQEAWGSRLPAGTIRITGTAGPNVLVGSPSTKKHFAVLRGLAGNDRLLGDRRVTAYGGPGRDFCRAGERHGCERG